MLNEALAFRGGTALYKLHLKPPSRYSEDIDLVQISAGPAGNVMSALRETLDPWLGKPRYKQSEGRITFVYRFNSEETPPISLNLKIEINTRERFSVFGINRVPFKVASRWFAGECEIPSYDLDELLGTKLRALYQRRKGRDLFDLAVALDGPDADAERMIEAFCVYMDHGGQKVTRTQFERNLADKMRNRNFAADVVPLLAVGHSWDLEHMARTVEEKLIARLPDDG